MGQWGGGSEGWGGEERKRSKTTGVSGSERNTARV